LLSRLRIDLTCHMPDLNRRPLDLEFRLNGKSAGGLSLIQTGWLTAELDLSSVTPSGGETTRDFDLEIRAGRTWQPCSTDPASTDDRELSIAVCNIEIFAA